jgi:hypothetical protein
VKIRHTKWFLPVAIVLGLLLIGGVVWAAAQWQKTEMTGEGSLVVTTPKPADDFNYTIPTTLPFGETNLLTNGAFTVTATVKVANTGNQTITGFNLTDIVYPDGIVSPSLTVANMTILPGNNADVTFTLSGTAPSSATTIDLGDLTCGLTPTGP